ncbi:malonic semialdehyde reductase [Ferruginivarius sediminum]|uniref:Putative NADH dehydrogenase/NAD(P)H nitroreductase DRB17_02595 n=1 Tax=Ferruginivarius sediminum TaxID=2661937 RepID=A0A369TDC3_9PROT|nr:malonic semialdehyde reductase [Ferruginivarius sediminum]
MEKMLSDEGMDLIFREARTHRYWQDKPVSDVLLQAIWDLAKMGPTSANCSPMRVVFVTSPEAKEKLKPALMEGNVEKTMTAPATAIVAYDLEFHEKLPELYSQADARSWFAGKPKFIETTAFRNGSLQGAYLIIAARALGLDCGPMSGFDNAKVDEAFFPKGKWKSNFLCNIGYGEPDKLPPRDKRLSFDEACRIV